MKPIVDCWLDEVIHMPECEAIPEDDAEAIRYLAQWDYGEYHVEPIALSDLYAMHGRVAFQDEYVLFRSYCGDAALYRRGAMRFPNDL